MTGPEALRVAHVAPYYPPHLGGLQRAAASLATATAALGHHVTVATSAIGATAGEESHAVGAGRLTVRRSVATEVARIPVAPGMLATAARPGRHDVVHVHVSQALVHEIAFVGSRVQRAALVAHYHLDVAATDHPVVWEAYKRRLLDPILRRCHAVIALSDAQRASLVAEHGLAADRVEVVGNGVGERFFSAERPVRPMRKRVLVVGRLSAQKRIGLALDAIAGTDLELTICGDGELRDQLQQHARRLGLEVTWTGHVDHDDLVAWYAWADVLLATSEREGDALVFLEAMAAGVPVVAARAPGVTGALSGVGVLADPHAASIRAALLQLLGDPSALADAGARGRANVADRRWSDVAGAVIEVYRSAIGRARG